MYYVLLLQVDVDATKTERSSQKLSVSRLEKVITDLQNQMAKETFNRIQLKFLSTNVDRDLREEYDSESETYFVSKVHIPNP